MSETKINQKNSKVGFWHWPLKFLYLVIWVVFLANFYIYLYGESGSQIAGVSLWGILVFNFIFIHMISRLRGRDFIDNHDVFYGILIRSLGIALISFSWTSFASLRMIFINTILGLAFYYLYFKLFAQTPLKKSRNWIFYALAIGSVLWAVVYQLRLI